MTAPLVEGRARDEVRVLKFVAATDADAAGARGQLLTEYARRCGTRRIAIRVQGDATRSTPRSIARGASRALDRLAEPGSQAVSPPSRSMA
ncbi:MAG: hypothetical protein U5K74_05655 [Gemmatimonadaceae bacterium]|nr:hypothetical protein [Gemmatimonadaceae bacterium]